MNSFYALILELRFLLITFLFMGNSLIGQTVEPPVLISTESNGVKLYSSKGFEDSNIQLIQTTPAIQPPALTIDDLTIADIDNILLAFASKLAYYESINDEDGIKLILEQEVELLDRKNELINQN